MSIIFEELKSIVEIDNLNTKIKEKRTSLKINQIAIHQDYAPAHTCVQTN